MPVEYIEYMMGHKMSTYHDIQMKGTDFLRNVYSASGLSIKPKTKVNRIDALKEIIRAWGLNPEQILTREALNTPARTHINPDTQQNQELNILHHTLRDLIRQETTKITDS